MRLAVVGYGQMGKEVEAIAARRGHQVVVRIAPHASAADVRTLTPKALTEVEMAVEFSQADAVVANAKIYAEARVPAVVGTTGWTAAEATVRAIVEQAGLGYLYGSNFSIGAHVFFRLVANLARHAARLGEYDLLVLEHHHRRKKDSPSGTALTAARTILANHPGKTKLVTDSLQRPPAADELHVASVRGGEEPGTHRVMADSEADTITLEHRARSRGGFALGAIRAAEWLQGRTGFLTTDTFMADLLAD